MTQKRGTEQRRVLLLNPGKKAGFGVGRIHMGLSLLARILADNNHDVRIVDFAFLSNTGGALPKVQDVIDDFRPDIIGISAFTFLYNEVVEMLETIANSSSAPILLGGPHITTFPDDFANDTRVSYLVCGEAENEILNLVRTATRQALPVKIISQKPTPDQIPAANLDAAIGVDTLDEYQIQLSRGCPYQCSFCTVRNIAGCKPRGRSLDTCIKELIEAKRRFPRIMSFAITDDCPTFDRNRFKTFLRMLSEAKTGCKLTIDNLRARDVDEELMKLFMQAGGQNMCLGVESGNATVFKLVNKGESLEEIIHAAKLVRKNGLALGLCFVIGLPEDTLSRHSDSIALAKNLKPDYIYWNMCVPWPETDIMKWFLAHGSVGDVRNFSTLVDSNISFCLPAAVSADFSRSDRIKAWLMANMETYAFNLTIPNIMRLRVLAKEYGLQVSLSRFLTGKVPHDIGVLSRKICRVYRNMGLNFLLLFLFQKLRTRMNTLFARRITH